MTSYSGWELDCRDRAHLLTLIKPTYPDVVAHHVTYAFPGEDLPPDAFLTIYGVADHFGVQALLVSVDGEVLRPDGLHYHVTWSLDRAIGRKPVHSNDVIAEHGFEPIDHLSFRGCPKVFHPTPEPPAPTA